MCDFHEFYISEQAATLSAVDAYLNLKLMCDFHEFYISEQAATLLAVDAYLKMCVY